MMSKKPRAALVGNAAAFSSDTGGAIDEHDVVIRMNRFRTQGLEDRCGGRCDIWAINGFLTFGPLDYYQAHIEEQRAAYPMLDRVVCLASEEYYCQDNVSAVASWPGFQMPDTDRVRKQLHALCRGSGIGVEKKVTTGLLAVVHFMNDYELTLFGFDFGQSAHYWGAEIPRDIPTDAHDWANEERAIRYLVGLGALRLVQHRPA